MLTILLIYTNLLNLLMIGSSRVVPANDEQSRGLSELRRRREEKQARSWVNSEDMMTKL
jgi:hypothetical protein